MRRTCLLASVLLLGGCYSYQSVSGRVYDADTGGSQAALIDSGSINLQCAPAEIRGRRIAIGHHRHGTAGHHAGSLLIAEGCGQRATYVAACSSNPCELILVSKVGLD